MAGHRLRHWVTLAAAAILALSTVACNEAGGARSGTTVRDSAGVAIVENDLAQQTAICSISPEPVVSIGQVDGPPEYELYRVFGATKLSDGRIALVNQGTQQLRYFDAQGRFLSASGREGQGPGEFSDAFYLWPMPGDTIWVGDYRPWQFLVFDPQGNWVRTVRPTPLYGNSPAVMSVLADGRSVLATQNAYARSTIFQPRELTVVVHRPDGTLQDTVGTFPHGRWGVMSDEPGSLGLYPLFESFLRLEGSGSRAVLGHSSKAEIQVLEVGDDVRLDRLVRWTAGDRSITQEEIDAERRRLAEGSEDMEPDMRRRLIEPLVSPERPIADELPTFAAIMIGRDGRIWLQEFARPTAPEPLDWLSFDAEGKFVCRAEIPAFSEILEFGADYLLVEHRDELGIEKVQEYRLTGPSSSN
jgi:hypothetical protein